MELLDNSWSPGIKSVPLHGWCSNVNRMDQREDKELFLIMVFEIKALDDAFIDHTLQLLSQLEMFAHISL